MLEFLLLLGGIALAVTGGELFVRGTVGIAIAARVPAGIVAATLAAFATSAPELSVGVSAAVAGQPEIALGDALGSNVVNLGVVLAVTLLLGRMIAERAGLRRDLPVALAAPALTGLLLIDGTLSRVDGLALLVVFAAWLSVGMLQATHARSAAGEVLGSANRTTAALWAVLGLALLVGAGQLIVQAAKGFGELLGLDTFVVGATLVALGTSTPELATALIAQRRGHDEIGLGTLIGSNIFNNLWIGGVAAVIHPVHVDGTELLVALAAGSLCALAVIPGPSHGLGRQRGVLLLLIYGAYLATLLTVAQP